MTVRPRNPERAAKARVRNFTGDVADLEPKDAWIRSFPCVACGAWPTVAAHAIPRGMGGCGGDASKLVPLCQPCHIAANERGSPERRRFESRGRLLLDGETPGRALIRIAGELDADWRRGVPSYGAPY